MADACTLAAPLALLYGVTIRARNAWYDHARRAVRRADIPVISIGNITTGGTGKTPFVIEIVRQLLALGRRPAILTRGYGGPTPQALEAEREPTDARPIRPWHPRDADEVCEFHEALPMVPVVVNPDRVAGAATAREQHKANCLVLDDGFQHRRLGRDLDLVLIDALNPWGGGWLLPAGRLREPLSSLRRADAFVITRANQAAPEAVARIAAELDRRAGGKPVFTAVVAPDSIVVGAPSAAEDWAGERRPADKLAGRRLLTVCGLGNPATFQRLVASVAGEPAGAAGTPCTKPAVTPMRFRDHHRYTHGDVAQIRAAAERTGAELVVTTRKDWVKLAPLWTGPPPLARLDVRVELSAARTEFTDLLRRTLEKRR